MEEYMASIKHYCFIGIAIWRLIAEFSESPDNQEE